MSLIWNKKNSCNIGIRYNINNKLSPAKVSETRSEKISPLSDTGMKPMLLLSTKYIMNGIMPSNVIKLL